MSGTYETNFIFDLTRAPLCPPPRDKAADVESDATAAAEVPFGLEADDAAPSAPVTP
ncbi:hypothetical protein [Anaeromyxobacter oryzae]|uniref:Uncharacterized protein n=1 Tax=Anaeromyxobacter oryzae TaxID=2918170 RepID=A0ABN6MJB8_9BACT|nr:hypothetical protein [Anaeromyxobacter oryzae]BDG01133.1 hypothetical protein AMOR_01290 [Anaeromyxobacter oryzae]